MVEALKVDLATPEVAHSVSTKLQGRGGKLMPDSAKAEMHAQDGRAGVAKEGLNLPEIGGRGEFGP